MAKIFVPFLLVLLLSFSAKAQELNCEVTINTDQLQSVPNKRIFTEMRNQIFNFMNNNRWTNDVYKAEERINCKLFITITNSPEIGIYHANVQIISSRPVYGTGYESVVLSNVDKDWVFDFNESQPLQFSENAFTSNLASLLSFYAYVIIGMDMDTYAKKGGSTAYDRAINIMSNVGGQGGANPGWKAFEGTRNRYWLVTNLLDPQMEPVRTALYTYFREGMDVYATKPEEARTKVLASIRAIQSVAQLKPGAALLRAFFEAKSDELVNVMKGAAPADKQAAFTILSSVDPTNTDKYSAITR